MIRVALNAAGESTLTIRLSNGWTIRAMPHGDGTATLAGWASHSEAPTPGRMAVASSSAVDGDGLAEFIGEVAAIPAPVSAAVS